MFRIFVKKQEKMEKLEISEEIKLEIITKFNNGTSLRKIEKEYPYSFTVIQKLVKSGNWENNVDVSYPPKIGFEIIAVCKKTGKIILDYKNTSGAIARHVFELYPEEAKKSKFIRKSVEYKANKFWYDEYFNFEYRIPLIIETKKCYYCDWTTSDINNLAGAYGNHLKSEHNKTPQEYLIDNPSDVGYFKHLTPKEPAADAVECKICGKKFSHINNIHLKSHNITSSEYKIKYGGEMFSKSTKDGMKLQWENNLKDFGFKRISSYEKIITEKIPEIEFKLSDRKILNGQEIDLLSIKDKIGIEVDGIFYHSEIGGNKDRSYHLNKTTLANSKGIKLIHIFEDEIRNKEDIVINKLKHIFNVSNSKKIHGRKCIIQEISSNEKKVFLEKYHIQGNSSSTLDIGAYYDNELVAVMSFSNTRNMNKEILHDENIYELTRFATAFQYIINGIASKLLKFFINLKKPNKIISFADRRWTLDENDNLYIKLGFSLIKTLPPDYSYTNNKLERYQRFHKFGFGKNALKKYYPSVYDDSKTEWEMMQELGYDRIWDCGKFKYELVPVY